MLKKFLLPVFLMLAASLSADTLIPDWLIAEYDKKDALFDVFYIHPTLLEDKKNPFPDFKNAKIRKRLTGFSRAQTGIFSKQARVFVPAVRQLEFIRCLKELKQQSSAGIPADSQMQLAVKDAVNAFRYYLKHWNPDGKRPYILLGHSQGASDLYEMMRQMPEITPEKGFVAAYLPGLPPVTEKQIRKDLVRNKIVPAQDEGSTGVIITWNTHAPGQTRNYFLQPGSYAINPLNWRTDNWKAGKNLHLGMTVYDHRTGTKHAGTTCYAQLDGQGALVVEELPAEAEKLYGNSFGKKSYHAGDIWIFSGNIAQNAALRVKLFKMDPVLADAKKQIREGKAECVLIRNGSIARVERGRGVSPLLRLYDREKTLMQGAVIVDKVIGRAAAAIAISGKASFVHARIMSEDAQRFLQEHGIPASCELKVHRILNRRRNGLCPLEQSVQGIDDPEQALSAMRRKIAEMMKNSRR